MSCRLPGPLVLLAATLLAAHVAQPSPVSAQPALTAILQTQTSQETLAGTAAAISSALRAEAGKIEVIALSATPSLVRSDLEFAVGCEGDSPACLSQIAAQLEVDGLLLSSLEQAGDALLLEITFFDRRDASLRRASRRAAGSDPEQAALDEVGGALRELFGVAEPAQAVVPEPPSDAIAPAQPATTAETPDADIGGDGRGPSLLLPIVLAGAGVAALGAGTVFGALASGSEADFTGAPVATRSEIDAAHRSLDRAKTQATLANVLFASGAGLLCAGALVLWLGGGDEAQDASRATLVPWAGAGSGGVMVSGTWEGRR